MSRSPPCKVEEHHAFSVAVVLGEGEFERFLGCGCYADMRGKSRRYRAGWIVQRKPGPALARVAQQCAQRIERPEIFYIRHENVGARGAIEERPCLRRIAERFAARPAHPGKPCPKFADGSVSSSAWAHSRRSTPGCASSGSTQRPGRCGTAHADRDSGQRTRTRRLAPSPHAAATALAAASWQPYGNLCSARTSPPKAGTLGSHI